MTIIDFCSYLIFRGYLLPLITVIMSAIVVQTSYVIIRVSIFNVIPAINGTVQHVF